eukprot:15364817-Ditylum_brightwellii.AAC.1
MKWRNPSSNSTAQTTPMAQPYLANMFGSYTEMEFGQQYQEGKADIESLETDIYTKDFYKNCKGNKATPHK